MKKRHTVLLLAVMLLLTFLCGCAQREVTVSELHSEDGHAVDNQGIEYVYSYHVPQIEDDTPDAAAINAEIAALYGEMAEAGLKSIESKTAPGYNTVTYESFRSGDVLALVIKCAYYYQSNEEYGVYHYDTAKGVRLTNADILAMKGVTQEQYLYAVRCAAAKCYDDQYFSVWKELALDASSGDYQERRSWILSPENITVDLPLYLDSDGVIHTIAFVGSHAGTGWVSQTITPDLEDHTAAVETEESLDYLTVTRQGSALTLRFNETPRGSAVLAARGYTGDVPYGKELPVSELYGDYTRIFCGSMGEQEAPYVFLLTREGRVEYVDVLTCLQAGYFCAGGPLLGVDDVKTFASGPNDSGVPSVYAMTGGGEEVDMSRLVEADQRSLCESFKGDWSGSRSVSADGGSYEESVWLALTGCDHIELQCNRADQETDMNSVGHLTYLGMTEDGLVYAYRSWGAYSNGPALEGAIALNASYDYSGVEPIYTLYITELSGTPFIGERTGETTALVRTFG